MSLTRLTERWHPADTAWRPKLWAILWVSFVATARAAA